MRARTVVGAISVLAAGAGAFVALRHRTAPPEAASLADAAPRVRTVSAFGEGPARFEPNLGQSPESVRFVRRGPGHATLIEDSGFMTIVGPTYSRGGARESCGHAVAVRFVGAAARPASHAEDELPGRTQYFVGHDESSWVRNVPNFARARFEGVWPGVDVVYHGADGNLEYDFVVSPGADAGAIAFDVDGADSVGVDATGDLVIDAGAARIRHRRPRVVESGPRGTRAVACRFDVEGDSRVRLRLGAHDPAATVVIDPLTLVGQRAGGLLGDNLATVATGPGGKTSLVGATSSVQFLPVAGPLSVSNKGLSDGFAVAFTITGTATSVLYTAVVGSAGDECFTSSDWGNDGTLFATGFTTSQPGFPSVSPPQTSHFGLQEASVAAINPLGTALTFAGVLGGTGDDLGTCISFDPSPTPAVFVGIGTNSTDVPFAGTPAIATAPGGQSLAIVRLTGAGVATGGTYLGGADDDAVRGLYLTSTPDHGVIAAFSTTSPLTTTPGAFGTTGSGTLNGFVARLPSTLSTISSSTFLAAPGADFGVSGIAAFAGGGFIVTGITSQGTIPTTGNAPVPTKPGFQDGFYFTLADDLRSATSASYVGTSSYEDTSGVAVSPAGAAYLVGTTYSGFTPAGGGRAFAGTGPDLWIAQTSAAGGPFPFVSNVGSTNNEFGAAYGGDSFAAPVGNNVAISSGGLVLVGGVTSATTQEYPILDGVFGGQLDVFAQSVTTADMGTVFLNFPTLKVTKGSVRDTAAAGGDKLSVNLAFGTKTDGQTFGDVTVGGAGALGFQIVGLDSPSTVGDFVTDSIDFAAAGWKSKRGGNLLVFNGTTSAGAHAAATIDLTRRTGAFTLTGFDAPFTLQPGPALLNFDLGDHHGSAVFQDVRKKPGTYAILPPLTGVAAGISFSQPVVHVGEPFALYASLRNYDGTVATVTVDLTESGHLLGSVEQVLGPRDELTFLPYAGTATFGLVPPAARRENFVIKLDGRRAASATLKVQKPPPSQIVFSRTDIDFGTIPVGTDVVRTFDVTNNSAQTVVLNVPVLTGNWFIFPNQTVPVLPAETKQFDLGVSSNTKGPISTTFQIYGAGLPNGAVTIRGHGTVN